jgi:hypothetical protein
MVSIFGDAIGVALFPLLLAGHTGADLAAAFADVYLIAALVALLGLLPALAMRAAAPAGGVGAIVAAERNAPSAGS